MIKDFKKIEYKQILLGIYTQDDVVFNRIMSELTCFIFIISYNTTTKKFFNTI